MQFHSKIVSGLDVQYFQALVVHGPWGLDRSWVKALPYRNKVISECQLKDGIERFENRKTCADWSTQLLCGIQLAVFYVYLHIQTDKVSQKVYCS